MLLVVLAVMIPVVVVNWIKPAWIAKLTSHLGAIDMDDEVADWIVNFLLYGFACYWIYFFLFAPFGVLCMLGLRKCGAR